MIWSHDLEDYEKNGIFYFKMENKFEKYSGIISEDENGYYKIEAPYLYNVEGE